MYRSDYAQALRHARIATSRGDVAETERWLKICERYLAITREYVDLRQQNCVSVGSALRHFR